MTEDKEPIAETIEDRLGRLRAEHLQVQIQNERDTGLWRFLYRTALGGVVAGLAFWTAAPGIADRLGNRGERAVMVSVIGRVSITEWASAENLVGQIEQACAAPKVKALVLEIRSNGGDPVQADLVADALERCREGSGTPIHAVVEGNAHSAAYLIAAHADTITAGRFASVGSLGVIQRWVDFSEMADRFGVREVRVRSGQLKGGAGELGGSTPVELEVAQERVDDYARTFLARVRAGRGERLVASDDVLMSGRTWTAQQGLEMGLVDRLGTLADLKRGELDGLRLQANRPRLVGTPGDRIGDVLDRILKLLSFVKNGPGEGPAATDAELFR